MSTLQSVYYTCSRGLQCFFNFVSIDILGIIIPIPLNWHMHIVSIVYGHGIHAVASVISNYPQICFTFTLFVILDVVKFGHKWKLSNLQTPCSLFVLTRFN